MSYTYNGKTLRLKEWSTELGISVPTLVGRLYRYGWSIQRAFSTPVYDRATRKQRCARKFQYKGESLTLRDLAVKYSMPLSVLRGRFYKAGGDIEAAMKGI